MVSINELNFEKVTFETLKTVTLLSVAEEFQGFLY